MNLIAMCWASGCNSLVYGWDSMPLYLWKGERSEMQWSKHPTNKLGVAAVYEAEHCVWVKEVGGLKAWVSELCNGTLVGVWSEASVALEKNNLF